MKRSKSSWSSRAGSVTIMTAAASVLIFGCMALAIDYGWVVSEQSRLQTAVNSGWKAGFDFVQQEAGAANAPLNEQQKSNVKTYIMEVLSQNGFPADALRTIDVTFGPANQLKIVANKDVGLFFSRIMNFETMAIGANRSGTDNSGLGVVPLGIPHGVVKDLTGGNHIAVYLFQGDDGFEEGKEYILKMGSGNPGGPRPDGPECPTCGGKGKIQGNPCPDCGGTGVSGGLTADPNDIEIDKQSSNFGALDPDNKGAGGANDYRDRFMFGFNQNLEINDRVMMDSGNIAGPTDQAVAYRFSQNPPIIRVVIPIMDVPPEAQAVHPDAQTLYALQQQDHPDGVYDASKYSFQHSPRIIGFAEFDLLDSAEWSRVGTNYDLGDSGDLGPANSGQVRAKFVGYLVKPGEVPLN